MTISITPAQTKALSNAGLGIERSQVEIELPNGELRIVPSVEIFEDSSDMLVIYTENKNGSLSFHCAPEFIEDLPAHIKVTRNLTAVCKYLAKAA